MTGRRSMQSLGRSLATLSITLLICSAGIAQDQTLEGPEWRDDCDQMVQIAAEHNAFGFSFYEIAGTPLDLTVRLAIDELFPLDEYSHAVIELRIDDLSSQQVFHTSQVWDSARGKTPNRFSWNFRDTYGELVGVGSYEIDIRARVIPRFLGIPVNDELGFRDYEGYPGVVEVCSYSSQIRVLPIEKSRIDYLARAIPAGYYSSADDTNGATLRSTLHDIIDDHVRFPYTSTATDCWDVVSDADEDPSNSSNVVDVYLNESLAKCTTGTGCLWDREHSWPNSLGFPGTNLNSGYPYNDCHTLRAAHPSYNSSRSNKPYDTCTLGAGCTELVTELTNGVGGGSGTYTGNSNWHDGSAIFSGNTPAADDQFETWDHRKGDVARGILYMDLRYNGDTDGIRGDEPDLIATDTASLILSSSNAQNPAYMGYLTTLLAWHDADPPDAEERARNDAVYGHQLNRNPFVDQPEWVECVYLNQCNLPDFAGITSATDAAPCGFTGITLVWPTPADWNDGGNASARDFKVFRDSVEIADNSTGCHSDNLTGISTTCTDDEPASAGGPYEYQVQAINDLPSATTGDATAIGYDDASVMPTISNVSVDTSDNGATITWDTNVLSDSEIDWGLTVSYGTNATSATDVRSHSLNATGLTPNTTYHYQACSESACTAGQNCSTDATFTTDSICGIFINEIHYDDDSGDLIEGVEIAGPAGFDLTGWTVEIYNGSTLLNNGTIALSGTIDNEANNAGALWFAQAGLQNATEGLALVDASNNVIEFLCYEGTFIAGDGPASGMTCTDIGVNETNLTGATESLQRTGTGFETCNLSWTGPTTQSKGSLNTGETLSCDTSCSTSLAISSLSDAGTTSQFTASWTTNEFSDRLLEWGTASGDYTSSDSETCNDTSHSLTATGLDPVTTYYYRVCSQDACGAETVCSAEQTYVTPLISCTDVFINEIHYDNDGADANEGFEIAGPTNFNLENYKVVFYDGGDQQEYNTSPTYTFTATDIIDNEGAGSGALWFAKSGIQNGAPDGLALVDPSNNVLEFICYEGSFTVNDVGSPAHGMTCTDIGVLETDDPPTGTSVQRTGTGTTGSDFSWTGPTAASEGTLNAGQVFTCVAGCNSPTGINTITATEANDCTDDDVAVTWPADPTDWGDGDTDTNLRTYEVLRDGVVIEAGGCDSNPALAYGGSLTCSDTDPLALDNTQYTYSVRYTNSCGTAAASAGSNATDNLSSAPDLTAITVTATDADACNATGNSISWPQDAANWNDNGGTLSRTIEVLRDGAVINDGGGCDSNPALSYGTTACSDDGATATANHSYTVRYTNNCAITATTAGSSASDDSDVTNPVISSIADIPHSTALTITYSTDDAGDTEINWGTSSGNLVNTISDASLLTAHDGRITGRSQNEDIYYEVCSTNACSLRTCSAEQMQTTIVDCDPGNSTPVFINEIHYDDDLGDENEGFEIAGPAGTDLTNWNVELYNGSDQMVYTTIALSGTLPDNGSGWGTTHFVAAGFQNGNPDGFALSDASSTLRQFSCYGGTFTAADGAASGETCSDIGVTEPGTTVAGSSLQLAGTGFVYEDFVWQSEQAHTRGATNTGQTFECAGCKFPSASGVTVTATGDDVCAADGFTLSWDQDATFWLDGGAGTRSYTVRDNGVAIGAGGCSGTIAYGASPSCSHDPADNLPHDYTIRFENGCSSTGDTPANNITDVLDITAPALSGYGESATATSFTATWSSDDSADSYLEWGLTGNYGSSTQDATDVTSHSLSATNLQPGTLYRFRVCSTNACGGGPTCSSQRTITTAAGSSIPEVGDDASSEYIILVRDETTCSTNGYCLYYKTVTGASRYNVYEGPQSDFASHVCAQNNPASFSGTGDWSGWLGVDFAPSTASSRYFLVTGDDGSVEGTAGFDSSNIERNTALNSCAP